MSKSDDHVYRHQILASMDGPRAERVNQIGDCEKTQLIKKMSFIIYNLDKLNIIQMICTLFQVYRFHDFLSHNISSFPCIKNISIVQRILQIHGCFPCGIYVKDVDSPSCARPL